MKQTFEQREPNELALLIFNTILHIDSMIAHQFSKKKKKYNFPIKTGQIIAFPHMHGVLEEFKRLTLYIIRHQTMNTMYTNKMMLVRHLKYNFVDV